LSNSHNRVFGISEALSIKKTHSFIFVQDYTVKMSMGPNGSISPVQNPPSLFPGSRRLNDIEAQNETIAGDNEKLKLSSLYYYSAVAFMWGRLLGRRCHSEK
jgi:hypothetical protein